MKTILQKGEGDVVLRKIAEEVPIEEITSLKIQNVLKEMREALASQNDGVAIAAPQIGYSLSIFVVSGKIFNEDFVRFAKEVDPENSTEKITDENIQDQNIETPQIPDLIFINPKISKLSRDKEWLPEGCLSVRWLYGKVLRSIKATVTAYDENGKKFTRGASGLLAQIFQHETDHLKGKLFIDTAKDIHDEPPIE
ncbi:MAG: peptide deformylase [Candidatus Pacebacteria bacterium]|nr:peptide deformylase [Candidatus Paceibacterota bacterium]MCF7862825.1 peptide deformylase [Candidatus Paceibacterota bacterium]